MFQVKDPIRGAILEEINSIHNKDCDWRPDSVSKSLVATKQHFNIKKKKEKLKVLKYCTKNNLKNVKKEDKC